MPLADQFQPPEAKRGSIILSICNASARDGCYSRPLLAQERVKAPAELSRLRKIVLNSKPLERGLHGFSSKAGREVSPDLLEQGKHMLECGRGVRRPVPPLE
jgi:hypothetical protein